MLRSVVSIHDDEGRMNRSFEPMSDKIRTCLETVFHVSLRSLDRKHDDTVEFISGTSQNAQENQSSIGKSTSDSNNLNLTMRLDQLVFDVSLNFIQQRESDGSPSTL